MIKLKQILLENIPTSGLGLSDNDIKDFLQNFTDVWNGNIEDARDEKERERQEKIADLKSKFGEPIEAATAVIKDPKQRELINKQASEMTPEEKEKSRAKAKEKGDPVQKMANARKKIDTISKVSPKVNKGALKKLAGLKVKNPKTGKHIKVTSALKKGHPAYKAAIEKIKKKKVSESSLSKRHGKFGGTGVPFPTEAPNQFAYIDFAKYVKKNEKKIKKSLRGAVPGKIFPLLQMLWRAWDTKANDGAFSNIKGNNFGRELALMLRKDNLLFDKSSHKITNLKA